MARSLILAQGISFTSPFLGSLAAKLNHEMDPRIFHDDADERFHPFDGASF